MQGENLFLTGAAGTGKSFLLRYLIQELEKAYPGKAFLRFCKVIACRWR